LTEIASDRNFIFHTMGEMHQRRKSSSPWKIVVLVGIEYKSSGVIVIPDHSGVKLW